MAIRGYFEPRRFPLHKISIPGGIAGGGIRGEGSVLEGRMSVEEALVLSWIRGSDEGRTVGVGATGMRGFDAEFERLWMSRPCSVK